MIDTHCHFDAEEFDADRAEIARRCVAVGVDTIVIPGYVAAFWPRLFAVCNGFEHPRLLPAPGLHPCYIEQHEEAQLDALEALMAAHPQTVAVGEIGLDYFLPELKAQHLMRRQQYFFRSQLQIASRFGKPVLLHVRKAHADVLAILRAERFAGGGIVHAFSGGIEEARRYVDLGFRLGIGGPITYEQSRRLRTVVDQLPPEALVLETDAPDMIPQAHRQPGQRPGRNSPEFLPAVAKALAAQKGLPVESLLAICTASSKAVLGLRAC